MRANVPELGLRIRPPRVYFDRVQVHYRGGHGFVEAPEDLLGTELKGGIFASITDMRRRGLQEWWCSTLLCGI